MSSYKRTTLTLLEVPSTIPSNVPFVLDDFALALTLGVRCKTIWYCIERKAHLYKRFTIPKKSGKKRVIFNPQPVLKHIQRRLNDIVLQPVPVLDCVGAYVPGRSCRDSAARHVGHAVRIAMDLRDFFPSHTRARVRRFFTDVIGYSHFVSGLIAELCTVPEQYDKRVKHIVPQGSPASPSLCNLIAMEALDKPVLQMLEGSGWVYTRYSDDLSLSHPEGQSREEVDAMVNLMRQLIENAGYRTNAKKLKIQRAYRRQHMLGMVINEHPNIPNDVYRRYRAIIHNCEVRGFEENAVRYGYDPPEAFLAHLQGKIAYFTQVNPTKAQHLKDALDHAVTLHASDPIVIAATTSPNPDPSNAAPF